MLLFVALGAWLDRARSRDWDDTLRVTVYPIAPSDDAGVRSYVAALQAADFADVESFFVDEASRYGRGARAARPGSRLARREGAATGTAGPSRDADDCALEPANALLRRADRVERSVAAPDIQVFALYSPLDAGAAAMPDSVGLSKGLIAVTHLYGDRSRRRQQPGRAGRTRCCTRSAPPTSTTWRPANRSCSRASANRTVEPLYPQEFGEIMAGRIATSARDAVIADSLEQMLVGPQTAHEIGWTQ